MGLPSAEPDRAAQLYHGPSGRQYHEVKRALPERALPWVMALRAAKLQPHIKAADTVFEFGAGAGWNLGKLQCARKIAYDEAEFLRESISAIGAEFVPNLTALPDHSVDVLICHHVLEHVLNPGQCLESFARLLKPEGKLLLFVPWERERRYACFDPAEPNHHLYTWNAQTLGNLIQAAGYELRSVRIQRYGYDRFAATLALQGHLGQNGFRILRKMLVFLRPLYEVEVVAQGFRCSTRKK